MTVNLNRRVTIQLKAEGAQYLALRHKTLARLARNGVLTMRLHSLIALFGPCFEAGILPFHIDMELGEEDSCCLIGKDAVCLGNVVEDVR